MSWVTEYMSSRPGIIILFHFSKYTTLFIGDLLCLLSMHHQAYKKHIYLEKFKTTQDGRLYVLLSPFVQP
jgi:hypothetical protein